MDSFPQIHRNPEDYDPPQKGKGIRSPVGLTTQPYNSPFVNHPEFPEDFPTPDPSGHPSSAQQAIIKGEILGEASGASSGERRSLVCRLIGYRFIECVIAGKCHQEAPKDANTVGWCLSHFNLVEPKCQSFRTQYHQCRQSEEAGWDRERGCNFSVHSKYSIFFDRIPITLFRNNN